MKLKVLVSDTAPLYPPMWGGPRRIWGLYSNFSQDLFDITYVGTNLNPENKGRYSFKRIRSNFKEILCAPAPHYYLWHILERQIFNNTSLDLFMYLGMHTDSQFRYILNSQNADILICSHPWSSLCVKKNKKQFFIYDAHNCEYLLMDQILRKHPLRNFVLKQVKKIESDACAKSDLILVCSEEEKKDFLNLYKVNANKVMIVSNGANSIRMDEKEGKEEWRRKLSIAAEERVIIFIGAYYKPNIQAVNIIIEQIAPALKDYKFIIIGSVSEAFKTNHKSSNIHFLGRVCEDDLDAALNSSDIAINPMLSGSGINIKMLDYMSYGLPIVTTEFGARGIETFSMYPMVISNLEDFGNNIQKIFENKELYARMSGDGRELIAKHYDWKIISNKLQNIIISKYSTAKGA